MTVTIKMYTFWEIYKFEFLLQEYLSPDLTPNNLDMVFDFYRMFPMVPRIQSFS